MESEVARRAQGCHPVAWEDPRAAEWAPRGHAESRCRVRERDSGEAEGFQHRKPACEGHRHSARARKSPMLRVCSGAQMWPSIWPRPTHAGPPLCSLPAAVASPRPALLTGPRTQLRALERRSHGRSECDAMWFECHLYHLARACATLDK